jgi:hypothetical protein
MPMLNGRSPATWPGWVHAFLLIIAMGVLAPLTMPLAVRGDASWRPISVMSLAASALFVVFLLLPRGNASFLMAVVLYLPGSQWLLLASAPLTPRISRGYSPPRCGPFVVRSTRTAPAKAWAAGQSQLRRARPRRRGGWSRR